MHKQAWDLKLELFHRRERQAVLEDKIETLETNYSNVQETNMRLVQEVESKDKALEEAVTMIVSLEARMELLLREREMTRQGDFNKSLLSHIDNSPSATLVNQGAIPRPQHDSAPNNKHTLDRVPSFLSEHTENTQNLRNVHLDKKPSYLSLSHTDSREDGNGFVSPSMSTLSESSFASVYGQTSTRNLPSPPEVPYTLQSRLANNGQRSVSLPSRDYTPGAPRGGDGLESRGYTRNGKQRDDAASPLGNTVTQITSGDEIERSTTVRPSRPQVFPRVRKESERSVRKVIVDNYGANHQALPPTPDTMTGSMVDQSQSCTDALRGNQNTEDARDHVFTRLTLDQTDEVEPGHWRFKSPEVTQPPSITAFTGRKEGSGAAYYENRLPALRRPRSADETTISRHKNDWDSCSDVDDLCSEASSFDYFLKEGLRPTRGGMVNAQTRTMPVHYGPRREPPDLFSFPSDDEGWQSNQMYGAVGDGYPGLDSPLSPALDALGASLPVPETGVFGSGSAGRNSPRPQGVAIAPAPPAPHRRSSLNAQTTVPGVPTIARASGLNGRPNEFEASRKRSVSGHSSNPPAHGWSVSNSRAKSPAPPMRPQAQHADASTPKRHYPPHASQTPATTRPRSRGITSLFRRSLGSANPATSASVPPLAMQSPFAPPPSNTDASPPMVGFPAWERRNDLAGGGARATPPPILRNRGVAADAAVGHSGEAHAFKAGGSTRQARASTFSEAKFSLGSGLSNMMALQDGGVPLTLPPDSAADLEADTAQATQGHGRRWFNLGRATNYKSAGT